MRFVLISDTHLQEPVLPKGEVLIHAGDLTASGSRRETERAMRWLGNVARNFERVVFVGGNHDFFFYHLSREAGVNAVREFVRPYGENIIYLENESLLLCTGDQEIKIYGSPAQPEFCNWAWNYARGAEIKAVWDKIPANVDMLITHGPPHHILDWVGRERVGCEELRYALDRVQPKVHVFGHIHCAYGKGRAFTQGGITTECYNAAVCGEAQGASYPLDPKHKPWVLDFDGKNFVEAK